MKNLALLSSALLLGASAIAQNTPQTITDFYALGVSPNGEWMVGQVEPYSVIIRNLVSGKTYTYVLDDSHAYGTGSGNIVSSTGVVVGTTDNMDAAYWENGEWHKLPITKQGTTNSVNAVTPDGSVICGNVGNESISIDAQSIMALPAVWYRQADGTYAEPVLLPHPELDFTGRLPQYITAVDISADGKVVIGQMQDYSGRFTQPLVYTRNEAGEWSYNFIQPQLTNPNNVEFPEYPGELEIDSPSKEQFMTQAELAAYLQAVDDYYEQSASLIYPEPEQFMSDEEYESYMEALNEYYETWENYPEYTDYMTEEELQAYNDAVEEYYEKAGFIVYPDYDDYMTQEELAEYEAAYAEYEVIYDEWYEKYQAFEDALTAVEADGFTYVYNNFRLSPDGKIAVTTRETSYIDWDQWMPVVSYTPVKFNLADDSYELLANDEDLLISYISADYTVLASYTSNRYPRRAYAITAEGSLPLEDFVAKTSSDNAAWMTENMTHPVVVGLNEETWEYIYADYMCSGIPYATPDLSLVVTTIENAWDVEGADYYSYVIPTGIEAGVENVAADGEYSLDVTADGTILLAGDFLSVNVYNVAGINVFSVANPAASVATGLGTGIYIVKAVTAANTTIVKKVVL